ncbi:MAG: hypothetical protein IKY83_08970 [Proteobacteria bacterium]|nr:hypothetical protein [Pseudomonadota bacterium]
MESRVYCILLVAFILCCAGCNDDRHKLEAIYGELTEISQMTDDCDKMGDKLAPVAESYAAILNRLPTVRDREDRGTMISLFSQCNSMFLEIQLGTCGTNKAVKEACEFTRKN